MRLMIAIILVCFGLIVVAELDSPSYTIADVEAEIESLEAEIQRYSVTVDNLHRALRDRNEMWRHCLETNQFLSERGRPY